MLLIWVSVVIALTMPYGEWDISLQHTTLSVIIHCGTNNVDQIIVGMLPWDKTYSFRRAKMDEANNTLKAKCMNLPQTNFMDQDHDWVKSDLALDENLYYKDFLHLAESANEKFSKTICLFLKQFLTEFRYPSSLSPWVL